MSGILAVWNYLKILPNIPVAKFPAIPPERAFEANEEAWLNLSHLENARVLVMVRIRAIAKKKVLWSAAGYIHYPEGVH